MKIVPAILLSFFVFACSNSNQETIIIQTDRAPEAIGPYSQGVLAGNTLYAAGQIGFDPETGEFAGEEFEEQAVQTMENLKAVVEAADMTMRDVVDVQVFLTEIDRFPEFNTIYERYFSENQPARAVVEVSNLPAGALVEVSLRAVRQN